MVPTCDKWVLLLVGGVAGETATQFMQHGFTDMIKCKNTLVGLCLLVLPFDLATMDLDFLGNMLQAYLKKNLGLAEQSHV